MRLLQFSFLIFLLSVLYFWNKSIPKIAIQKADLIIVEKSRRKLFLFKNGIAFREYSISLGKVPIGAKMKEGDKKTPEGNYIIDWRNPNSKFYLSLHISYPSKFDLENGKTGSNIMIHGLPNGLSIFDKLYFENRDWTDGCISVKNMEIEEIWNSVDNGTPILIKP